MMFTIHEDSEPESSVYKSVNLEYPEESLSFVPPNNRFAITVNYESENEAWLANIILNEFSSENIRFGDTDLENTKSQKFKLHRTEHKIIHTDSDLVEIKQNGKSMNKRSRERYM